MTLEERLKMVIGDLVIQGQMMQVEIEGLKLTAGQGKEAEGKPDASTPLNRCGRTQPETASKNSP